MVITINIHMTAMSINPNRGDLNPKKSGDHRKLSPSCAKKNLPAMATFFFFQFKKCLLSDEPFEIKPSHDWSDDLWFKDQKDRQLIENSGWLVINEGKAEGTLLGANLCTFNLLQGTEYMPDMKDSVLFLEDDETSKHYDFDRNLQSLIHLSEFSMVRGIAIGRFQKTSGMTDDKLKKIIETKSELKNIPVIANVDFGHTDPKITFPVGGEVKIAADSDNPKITIIRH